MKIKAHLKY